MPYCYPKPIPPLTQKQIERFWSNVDKTPGFGPKRCWVFGADSQHPTYLNRNCWFWIGRTSNKQSYGSFRIFTPPRVLSAHRVVFMLERVQLGSAFVLHKCDEPRCCNPDHLFLGGSVAINSADMVRKNRQAKGPSTASRLFGDRNPSRLYPENVRGERNGTAKLTAEQVRSIRSEHGLLREIADRYNMSVTAIWAIRCRKTWWYLP